jgi:hypothetical protein
MSANGRDEYPGCDQGESDRARMLNDRWESFSPVMQEDGCPGDHHDDAENSGWQLWANELRLAHARYNRGMSEATRKWRGPIMLLSASSRTRRIAVAAASLLVLYVASSGPMRSVLIRERFTGATRDPDGVVIWGAAYTDLWCCVYGPLESNKCGPVRAALERYWAIFPIHSDVPEEFR